MKVTTAVLLLAIVVLCWPAPSVGQEAAARAPEAPRKLTKAAKKGSNGELALDSVAGVKRGSRLVIDVDLPEQAEIVTVTAVDPKTPTVSASLIKDHAANAPVAIYEQQPCKITRSDSSPRGRPSDQGIITVGCPKVWRSDRVFTVLDGILRDVDSITLRALQDLDANKANATQLIQIVNDLQVAVKADQAAAINSALDRQKIAAERGADLSRFTSAQESNQAIQKRRQELIQRKIDLDQQKLQLFATGKTDSMNAVQAQINEIQAQLDDLNKLQTTPTLQAETLQPGSSTSASAANATTTPAIALGDLFKTILQQGLQNPSLPPAVQMDNVIELLHQRLSREFSVLYDDLSRQSRDYDIYLVQFDIGIVPRPGSKSREARVTLEFPPDSGILAYDLYPGASSYNTLRGLNKTSRVGLSGAAQTVMGFGLSANYSHERSELRSGLSQSLFLSGFGAGDSTFGWEIGASPFDDFINPGNRVVHAIILVPKSQTHPGETIPITVKYSWPSREPRYNYRGFLVYALELPLYGLGMPLTKFPPAGINEGNINSYSDLITMALPSLPQMTVKRISYNPTLLKETPGTQTSTTTADKPSTVQITFDEPVDPNLIVTVNDKLINRVRDVRGRGLYGATPETVAGNDKEQAALKNSRFGLLEADTLGPDTWLQLNSRSILLNLSKDTAGTDTFPTITLSDPGLGGAELLQLANQQRQAQVRVGEWRFENTKLPDSAFLPLYTKPYQPGRISVFVDTVDNGHPTRLRVISETQREGRTSPVWLHEQAQVILVPKDDAYKGTAEQWALNCDGEDGTLSCKVPVDDITQDQAVFPTKFKVWVDEPPYFDRPGFWADHDVERYQSPPRGWYRQPYYKGEWTEVEERCKNCEPGELWDYWHAEITVKNTEGTTYSLREGETNPYTGLKNKAYTELINALKSFKDEVANKAGSAPLQQRSYYNGLDKELTKALPEVPSNKGTNQQKPKPPLIIFDQPRVGLLRVDIAFEILPRLPDHLHLDPGHDCVPGKNETSCEEITLPDLHPKLLPGVVDFFDFGDGTYRLEGLRLRAVDQVLLKKEGKTILLPASVGYNGLTFSLKTATNQKPEEGKYIVYVMIRGVTVPVYQSNNNKLEQVTFTYPTPKETATKPKPDQSAAPDQSNVQLKMNIDVATDAKATKTNGGKPAGATSGTANKPAKPGATP